MASRLDEDTMRTVQSGRETAGTVLRAAQKHLQKVFIVWVLGLLATIFVLQRFLWDQLRRDLLYSKMDLTTAQASEIVAVTPFDVILLQVKIGAVVGILLALPVLIYVSRDGLRRRGYWPSDKVPAWKLATIGTASLLLFTGGVVYAYELFFPLMFGFLAENALAADFQPNYSIVMWVQFIVLLGMSFGLAAQMPLMMSALTYADIVQYETFRDKWKYAVVGIFAFGALFSPPDPFTQVMWAAPLVGLYAVSLGLSKLLVLVRRAGEEVAAGQVARARWNKLAAGAVVVGGAVYYLVATEAFRYVQTLAAWFPSNRLTGDLTRPDWFGLGPEMTAVVIAAGFGLVAAVLVLYYYMIQELDVAAAEAGHFGDPTAIDVGSLTADAVRAAPPEAFEDMAESEALQLADQAMSDDDPDKARAILDRWDQVHGGDDADAADATAGDAAAAGDADEGGNVVTETTAGMFNAFTEDETTEEDIGGYYYDVAFILDSLTSKAIWFVGTFMIVTALVFVFLYSGIPGAADAAVAQGGTVVAENGTVVAEDVTVVSENVTVLEENESASDGARVVAPEAVLTAREGNSSTRPSVAVMQDDSVLLHNASVTAPAAADAPGEGPYEVTNESVLVQNETVVDTTSGIGMIKNAFVAHLPPEMRNDVRFITLHPVEHLVFIVKFSAIMGAVAVLPLLLYFAWPAMRERSFVGGDRNTLAIWGGTIAVTLVGGSLVGFLYVAPTVISWLAYDVLQANMLISYRVAKFGWLVFMFTVGIGLLVEIPVTMLLFHRGGIISFQALQERWRPITLGVFVASALLSPKGIWTMFIVAIPITAAFLAGLALLWIYTLGGRRRPKAKREVAD